MARKPWDNGGKSTTERGYGWHWQKLRRGVLGREPTCRPCKAAGRVTLATEVDHIVGKADGGTDAEDNLRPICTACHTAKTIASKGGKPRAPIAIDGWPVE